MGFYVGFAGISVLDLRKAEIHGGSAAGIHGGSAAGIHGGSAEQTHRRSAGIQGGSAGIQGGSAEIHRRSAGIHRRSARREFTADLREFTADLWEFTADLREFTADLREFTADLREFTRIGRNSRGFAEMLSSSAVEHDHIREKSPQARGILGAFARFIANTAEKGGPLAPSHRADRNRHVIAKCPAILSTSLRAILCFHAHEVASYRLITKKILLNLKILRHHRSRPQLQLSQAAR